MQTGIFFTFMIPKNPCIVTVLAKNTTPKATVWKVEDTNKAKNDAIHVKYSLNGRVCGVHVADVC